MLLVGALSRAHSREQLEQPLMLGRQVGRNCISMEGQKGQLWQTTFRQPWEHAEVTGSQSYMLQPGQALERKLAITQRVMRQLQLGQAGASQQPWGSPAQPTPWEHERD